MDFFLIHTCSEISTQYLYLSFPLCSGDALKLLGGGLRLRKESGLQYFVGQSLTEDVLRGTGLSGSSCGSQKTPNCPPHFML